jgi:hypothetical protein
MVISTRLTDLVFEGNLVQSADNPGGTAGIAEGGALYTEEPEGASLTRVLFVDNSARGGDGTHGGRATGGGLILGDGTSTLTDVTFENNRAIGGAGTSQPGGDSEGGGLAGDHSTLVNVSFSGNVALAGSSSGAAGGNARGGGARLRSFGTTTTLRQLTVSGNRVQAGTGTGTSAGTAAGGGLHFAFLHAVGSSLLEGNTATVGATTTPSDCADEGSLTSLGYNTVGGSAACGLAGTGDQVGVGSSLLGIGDHGCSVPLPGGACLPTMPVRMSAPALDRGSCFGGNFSRDARSFLRPWDAPGVANAIDGCDAGAYESRDGDADGVEDWVDNCPFVANPTQLDRDLAGLEDAVALWRLDAGQGVNAGDGYGSHHGTLTGNPQWVSGISGSALAFDGVGDGVVIPHDAAFNPGLADGFSVTAWVWLPASQVQTGRTTNLIVGKDQEGGAGFPFPWVLRVFNQTAAAGAIGHLQGARSDGTLTAQVVSTSRIDDDRWHHAAFIKSGSMLEMWVDGVLEASVADATVAATTNTRDVGIGLRLPASAKLDLRGSVDEVLYVADSITGAQVLDLYQRRGLAGDGLGAACDCDDADPTNSSAVCANVFTNGFE